MGPLSGTNFVSLVLPNDYESVTQKRKRRVLLLDSNAFDLK